MPVATREKSWRKPKRKKKRRATLKDPHSTGRKEAARLYPLDRDKPCEWSFEYIRKEYAQEYEFLFTDLDEGMSEDERAARESGLHREIVRSISGSKVEFRVCDDNRQKARHHGPDKNTLNNEQGNVHRICHFCHNTWHAVNDEDYDWSEGRVSD